MGCGASSAGSAGGVSPGGRGALSLHIGGRAHLVDAEHGMRSPNIFKVLGIKGLDYRGNMEAMRASFKRRDEPDEIANTDSSVKVAVLVRPLLPFELQAGNTNVVKFLGSSKLRLEAKKGEPGMSDPGDGPTFDYDHVFNMVNDAASEEVFKTLGVQVAEKFCQGFNACMLAYGQTGSGKTYTMGTGEAGKTKNTYAESNGIIPRLMKALFAYVEAAKGAYDIELKMQYVELYNEQVNDLLLNASGATGGSTQRSNTGAASTTSGSKLDIREYPNGEVYIDGANSVAVETPADVAAVVNSGNQMRATAAHKLNEYSSRSHAVVSILMEQKVKPSKLKDVPHELQFLRSKLQLVDLAGSERAKGTGAEGARFTEGVNINKSLLELGNCINALTDPVRKHVPYRNSKLTRMLKDSLGGSSETLMCACVSPASSNYEQTLNTLRYAQRARAIRNNLRLNNQMTPAEEVAFLREVVAKLEAENSALKARLGEK